MSLPIFKLGDYVMHKTGGDIHLVSVAPYIIERRKGIFKKKTIAIWRMNINRYSSAFGIDNSDITEGHAVNPSGYRLMNDSVGKGNTDE